MTQAFRAPIFHCLADPGEAGSATATEFFDDGLLITADGVVTGLGDAEEMLVANPGLPVRAYPGKLIVPGLIDCHVHFPQVDIIASYGERLLDWLNRYAYPGEMRYGDADYANAAASFFLDELLRNGTTTAAVFATVHPESADAIFRAAEARNMRLIAGKVLMDRNSPASLSDNPESAYKDSKALIERWHGKGRLGYAITPRFAITSSEEQLAAAGRLASEYPDTWIHTHLAENQEEIDEVANQFPWSTSYLGVYNHFGLLRERSIFAHCLHLSDDDRKLMSEQGGSAAFCPSSNLFLGSGLYDLRTMTDAMLRTGLASDVGGGTSLSMLRTMGEAYKVLQLQHQNLPAARALYLATLGAAEALRLDDKIGNLEVGKEADFVVLDPAGTHVSERRLGGTQNAEEIIFALSMLADDRNIFATYVAGQRADSGESGELK
jgi:guanine deaminase